MGDEKDGPTSLVAGGDNGGDPSLAFGPVPIGLLDEMRVGHTLTPARLPMVRAGAAEAGDENRIEIGAAHDPLSQDAMRSATPPPLARTRASDLQAKLLCFLQNGKQEARPSAPKVASAEARASAQTAA